MKYAVELELLSCDDQSSHVERLNCVMFNIGQLSNGCKTLHTITISNRCCTSAE